jgi:hypothetical protein
MALETATGTFNTTTQAAGNTVTVSGLSFQPKLVIFTWSGRTATGQAEGDHKLGMGYMISSSDRGCATSQSDHGAANAAADCATYDDACIVTLTVGGAVDGKMDFSSLNSDGFTVVIDDAFPSSYLINYLAIGGSDLTNVASVTVTAPTSTGNQDITTVGFQPDAAIAMGGSVAPVNSIDTWSTFGVGIAAGSAPDESTLTVASQDGAGTSVTRSHCINGLFITRLGSDPPAVDERASISQWLSNGFQLNWAEVSASFSGRYRVVCLKGGKYAKGDLLTSTGTSNFAETGVGFTPKALFLVSHNNSQSTSDTTQAPQQISLGFAVSASSRNYVCVLDKDASGTMDIGVAHNTNAMYGNQSTATTIAIEGLMDLVSMDSDGFTAVMDDADPSAAFVWYLALGDAATTGPSAGLRTLTMTGAGI